jgi:hypothetical protein
LACETFFLGNRTQDAPDDSAKVIRDGDVRVGGIRGRDIDTRRLQAHQQASELFGDKVLVQSGNRFGWHERA